MPVSHVGTLSYAVRPRVVGRYVADLLILQAVLICAPILVSMLAAEFHFTWRAGIALVFLSGCGLAFRRLSAPQGVQANEALVISGSAFLIAPLVMTFPMMSSGLSFMDALFESVSGVTTTGLSTVVTVEDKPLSFLFSRAWMQWYGGLGVVVLSIGLLMRPGQAARRISAADFEEDNLVGGTRAHARRVLTVYLALTAFGFGLVILCGARPFVSLTHTLAAVSTGGFSSYDQSLAGLGGWTPRAAVLFVSLLGAVPLVLYYRAFSRGWRAVPNHAGVRWLVLMSLVISGLLILVLRFTTARPWGTACAHGFALGFSAQTTTGFSTTDISEFPPAAKLVLIVAMFIGGNLGSTAGGIKILRMLILLRLLQLLIHRTSLPARAVTDVRINGDRLETEEANDALLIIALFAFVVLLSWGVFILCGYDPLDSLFDVVSATGTVGLSTGVTGPDLSPLLKGVLCFDMIMGRVEMVALLTILYWRTWIEKRRES